MSDTTIISWCDSTVNPVMGCGGCELLLGPDVICRHLDQALRELGIGWKNGQAKERLTKLCRDTYDKIESPLPGHSPELTTTNIWHVKDLFFETLPRDSGSLAKAVAREVIEHDTACYAARLHFQRGLSILNPGRKSNPGYAKVFDEMTFYPRRAAKAATMPDLKGSHRNSKAWLNDLPRLIFVSDMGDAFCDLDDDRRDFLADDTMSAITSDAGKRHFWLWLTKRPAIMAKFAKHIGGFPENVCAMTTLTCGDKSSLQRLKDLKKVKAKVRGLSLEPLLGPIAKQDLDLSGLNWIIVGGESGNDTARPFDLQWARDIRDACKKAGVPFFMKQLGRKPIERGKPFDLQLDKTHGGDWAEWPEDLRIRKMPAAFTEYRKDEAQIVEAVIVKKGKALTTQEVNRFRSLNKTVMEASRSVVDAAIALAEIKRDRLYRQKHETFDIYCQSVLKCSRQYAYQLIKAGNTAIEMSSILDTDGQPKIAWKESHLQAYALIKDPEKRVEVYNELAEEVGPKAITTKLIEERAMALKPVTMQAKTESPSQKLQRARTLLSDLRSAHEAGGDIGKFLAALEQALGAKV